MTYTVTTTDTFSYTHARHIAAKVATDLKRIQRFYGRPSNKDIDDYQAEITELLKAGYLGAVTYGFQRNDNWIQPTLRYTAKELAGFSTNDDDPGRIRPGANVQGASFSSYLTYSSAWDTLTTQQKAPGANVQGASFSSYLTYSSAWDTLTTQQKAQFKDQLPIRRVSGLDAGITGAWIVDRTYSAGGRAVDRLSLTSY